MKYYTLHEKKKEQREWESLVFYFEDDKVLTEHIRDNWPSFFFVKATLNFFYETYFSSSDKMQQRMMKVTQIINQLFIPFSEKKSWFWKFRQVLYTMEGIFFEKNLLQNHFQFEKLLYSYRFIGDNKHFNRLHSFWMKNNSDHVNSTT